jgi:hypothetical protein
MAGVANVWKLNGSKNEKEAREVCDMQGVTYARLFSESDGRGEKEVNAFRELVSKDGKGKASSLRAMCWFLKWGATTGNTLNGIVGAKPGREEATLPFKLFMLVYYGPLFFGLINLVSAFLKLAPTVPKWFSSFFGVVLAIIAGTWFIPLGIIGMLIGATLNKKAD